MSDKNKADLLLRLARAAIAELLSINHESIDDVLASKPDLNTWVQQPGACFITLMQAGELRGCIGTLEAHRSLLKDVIANAKAAAFNDTRFPPLTEDEFEKTMIEVSLLSEITPLNFSDEQQALEQIRPEIDGIVFEAGNNRSTFLPQVWQQLQDKNDFMAHLKNKAGLPDDFWSEDVRLSRYTVSKFKEL